MAKIYAYFECKNMADLLHIYTLEDGILLAVKLSMSFEEMYCRVGVDPTHFTSAAKFSYTLSKRMTKSNVLTVPDSSVFEVVQSMRRAGFSLTKNQVTLTSPTSDHVSQCRHKETCEICRYWFTSEDLTVEEVKKILEERCEERREAPEEPPEPLKDDNRRIVDEIEFKYTQNREFKNVLLNLDEEDEKYRLLIDRFTLYYDENNQYGYALSKPLPIGSYIWLRNASAEHLNKLLKEKERRLEMHGADTPVYDFFTCVDIELPTPNDATVLGDGATVDNSEGDIRREELFNLLVRNMKPDVFAYSEQMLRCSREEYAKKSKKFKQINTHNKMISGVAPLRQYWVHSSMIARALANGWKITRVYQTLAYVAQSFLRHYIHENQVQRVFATQNGLNFLADFYKLLNNSLYGWFCRQNHLYKETQLMWDAQASFKYWLGVTNTKVEFVADTIEQMAEYASQNPHDDPAMSLVRMQQVYDEAKEVTEGQIQRLKQLLQNLKYQQKCVVTRRQSFDPKLDEQIADMSKKLKLKMTHLEEINTVEKSAIAKKRLAFDLQKEREEKMKKRLERQRQLWRKEQEEGGNVVNNRSAKKAKKVYVVPESVRSENTKMKSRVSTVYDEAMTNRRTCGIVNIISNQGVENVCFGMYTKSRASVKMYSKNDVAVAVLAYAKNNIGLFWRRVCDTLCRRMGADVTLNMSDTDSIAATVTLYHVGRKETDGSLAVMFPDILGSDVAKRNAEMFLTVAPEMENMIDASVYEKDALYFDDCRKKEVGLYADEIPLPQLITNFVCLGPKNYSYQTRNLKKNATELDAIGRCQRHRGIPQKIDIGTVDYLEVMNAWKKQESCKTTSSNGESKERGDVSNKDDESDDDEGVAVPKPPFPKPAKRLPLIAKQYTSHCFHTNASGVFLVRTSKRLSVSMTDKALTIRGRNELLAYGSKLARKIENFNRRNTKGNFNLLCSDEHLNKLRKLEKEFMNSEYRHFQPTHRADELTTVHKMIEERMQKANIAFFIAARKRDLERLELRAVKERNELKELGYASSEIDGTHTDSD